MEENKVKVYKAKSIQELQHILKTVKNVIPVAGGSIFSIGSDDNLINIGENIVALNSIPQLRHIHKTDRYIDFGACVTLEEILLRGKKHVPSVLYDALEKTANVAIRSVATIGGNLALRNPFSATYIPLIALDAQCEVCTEKEVFWMPVSKYMSDYDKEINSVVITRIRIKDDEWSYYRYKKIENGQYMDEIPIFLFLTKIQRNILFDIRLLFADKSLIREKEFENLLLGRSLPLPKEDIEYIFSQAKIIFKEESFSSAFNKRCFFNLLEKSLYKL
ncbi:MAG: FAD binding domain-containing protein [Treponema sp.]